jgi:hypothetical protein
MNRKGIDFVTRVLLVCATVEVIIAEVSVAIALRYAPHRISGSHLLTMYTLCPILAIPAIIGLRGFLALSRPPYSDRGDSVTSFLRRQYLFGTIWAYTAVILIVEAIR